MPIVAPAMTPRPPSAPPSAPAPPAASPRPVPAADATSLSAERRLVRPDVSDRPPKTREAACSTDPSVLMLARPERPIVRSDSSDQRLLAIPMCFGIWPNRCSAAFAPFAVLSSAVIAIPKVAWLICASPFGQFDPVPPSVERGPGIPAYLVGGLAEIAPEDDELLPPVPGPIRENARGTSLRQ